MTHPHDTHADRAADLFGRARASRAKGRPAIAEAQERTGLRVIDQRLEALDAEREALLRVRSDAILTAELGGFGLTGEGA